MKRITEAAAALARTTPWTDVYGAARTLLAFGTLLTLAFNDSALLFADLPGQAARATSKLALYQLNLFLIVPDLELARWIAVALLLVVASGWRPRFTGVLHWWVAASLAISSPVIDGGDQIAAVLTLLLIPITLTDGRRWHWSRASEDASSTRRGVGAIVAGVTMMAIRLQVAIIYFQAGVAKMAVTEWANGTAVYYWFSDPVFGQPAWLEPILGPLLTNPVTVVLLTWGTMLFEVLLFMALVMNRRAWQPLLIAGLMFHFGIVLVHGLVSFFFSMAAALVLYLRPAEKVFDLQALAARWRARIARRAPAGEPAGEPAAAVSRQGSDSALEAAAR